MSLAGRADRHGEKELFYKAYEYVREHYLSNNTNTINNL